MIRTTAIFAVVVLLVGCARNGHKPDATPGIGSASYRVADNTGLAHYDLAMGQVAMGATLQAHPAPIYPAAMLAACPHRIDLPARVIVDDRGTVSDVRISPPAGQQPFADAVRDAVRGWRYTPLTMTRWAADADGTSHPVDTEAKPFSLDYVFTFRCEHGHTQVSSAPEQAAR